MLTGDALEAARGLFDDTKGDRPAVQNLIVLLTDGQSTNNQNTLLQANAAKMEQIKIICIGIGNGVDNQELLDVSSGDDYVFHANDFIELEDILEDLVETACNASTEPMSTTTEPTTLPTTIQPTTNARVTDEPGKIYTF